MPEDPSIRHAPGDTVRVQLIDAATARPIAGATIEVTSSNGITCVKAPCPTDTKVWTGMTDASARVAIPKSAMNTATTVKSGAYFGDLVVDAIRGEKGEWTLELFANGEEDNPPHPLKLIDAHTRKAIANTAVRIESRGGKGKPVRARSNALGYVLVPFDVVAQDEEDSWLVVPGYRDAHIDFGWVNRKMLLKRK
jgi:hypothetical protein